MIDPVTHRILIKQLDVYEEDTDFKRARAAGIELPKQGQMEREQAAVDRGEVVKCGPTSFKDFGTDNPLKVGDIIVFARHGGKTVRDPDQAKDDTTKYIVLNDEDVIAVLTKKDNSNE